MQAWDTTVVSRLHPGSHAESVLVSHAREGQTIAVPAPAIMEVVRGLASSALRDPRFRSALSWFVGLGVGGLFETLPLDRRAAVVAGRMRAMRPVPPTVRRRRGTKTEQRAGWVLDMQIAACAWVHGREIATENRRDFEVLRDLIADLYPDTSPLDVIAQ